MGRRQIRDRRKKAPVVLLAKKAKAIVGGIAKCRLNREQVKEICLLCGISQQPSITPFRRAREVAHELELIVQRYWQNDARHRVLPSNSMIEGQFSNLVAVVEKLENLLRNPKIRISIVDADLRETGKIRIFRGMFKVDELEASLSELRNRAMLVMSRPRGRETTFKSKSNAQSRPFDIFLCEVVRFWHLELGNTLPAQGKKGSDKSNLYSLCQFLSDIGGRSMERPALRLRVSGIIKTMHANDNKFRKKGEKSTMNWTI